MAAVNQNNGGVNVVGAPPKNGPVGQQQQGNAGMMAQQQQWPLLWEDKTWQMRLRMRHWH